MIPCCPPPSNQVLDNRIIVHSLITCPHCKTTKMEQMPVDACRIAYECSGCHLILRPRSGDCCVFVHTVLFHARPFKRHNVDKHERLRSKYSNPKLSLLFVFSWIHPRWR